MTDNFGSSGDSSEEEEDVFDEAEDVWVLRIILLDANGRMDIG